MLTVKYGLSSQVVRDNRLNILKSKSFGHECAVSQDKWPHTAVVSQVYKYYKVEQCMMAKITVLLRSHTVHVHRVL